MPCVDIVLPDVDPLSLAVRIVPVPNVLLPRHHLLVGAGHPRRPDIGSVAQPLNVLGYRHLR